MIEPKIRRRPQPATACAWPSDCHPVLQRVYAARGALTPQAVEHRLAALLAPQALGGLQRACALLETAIRNDNRIVVVGDFDADGATGSAVAVRGLRLFGARQVQYQVPNRVLHGYGLSPALVETLAPQRPELIITVDNGISSLAGIAAARRLGMTVIVTDHHVPGKELPAADAIVNPNLPGDEFPSKALAGVGVMFYLLMALRSQLRAAGWFAERGMTEPDLAELLDLVALGTVADLVALDFNNRVLVAAGLKRIRAGRACAGIRALIVASQRSEARLVAADLGYALAPRINAAGRLEDMSLGIECLLSDDATHAAALAERLSAINAERRELQTSMVEQGEALVSRWDVARDSATLPVGVCLFDADWHAGVIGLVASRLKERLNRPVIALAPAGDGSRELRGSARSIAGFHIRDALAEVDARQPGLLLRFGGHAMAAGLTLLDEHLDVFTALFDSVARERLAPEQLEAVLLTDGELQPEHFDLALAVALRESGPWGQGFPEPLFDNEFQLDSWKVFGNGHLKLNLRPLPQGAPVEGVMFSGYRGTPPPARLRAAYQLDVDDWRGQYRLRLLVRHIEPL